MWEGEKGEETGVGHRVGPPRTTQLPCSVGSRGRGGEGAAPHDTNARHAVEEEWGGGEEQ